VTVRGLEPQTSPYLGRASPFGGTHAGGAIVLFADGSARFLKESISPEVFQALATIAGGEEVGPVGD
jgi:prepilin-type processing-associated H-X9-DG protein